MSQTNTLADQIRRDIDAISRYSECDQAIGHSRPTFSDCWRAARNYVTDQMKDCCYCVFREDAAGNIFARHADYVDQKVWLCGSHIDSVPTGGKYDGVTGIVVAMELLRSRPRLPVELVIFAEEEGTTFGLGMLGSRAMVGELTARELGQLRNAAGHSYLQAGLPHGVLADQIALARLNPAHYHGLIEVHVEQGPALWKNDQALAVVTAISGRKQFKCTVSGIPNHAGSTAMVDRSDALVGAATLVISLESLARELGQSTVITVGRFDVHPNAINVIPGQVEFTIDLRGPDAGLLEAAEKRIEQIFISVTRARHLQYTIHCTESKAPVAMDARICDRLRRAARNTVNHLVPDMVSGALHDAAILAPHLPTAMLFVASQDGISHNPAEFSRAEDIALAVEVVRQVISEDLPPAND